MKPLCSFEGCEKPARGRGLCEGHSTQQRRGQDLRPLRVRAPRGSHGICSFEGCDNHATRRGFCSGHYTQWRHGRELVPLQTYSQRGLHCSYEPCEREVYARGLCSPHYSQQWRGEPLRPIGYRGKRGYKTKQGYVRVYNRTHPNAGKDGMLLEHVEVMAELLGRPLLPGENVHHRNGVRDDNRPENLELWVTIQPSGQRPEDLVAYAHEILERYGPMVEAA